MQLPILKIFHNDTLAGHLGVRKTYSRLEQRVYWYGMRSDVSKFVKSCKTCQEYKQFTIPTAPASSFIPDSPWQLISADLMGPYPKTAKQNEYILVVLDMFSKYVEIFPLRQATSRIIIDRLWEVCCRWGIPKTIVTDNGPQFTSKIFMEWCNVVGLIPFHIAVYHAQSNMTERYNETIKQMIVTNSIKSRQWDKNLNEIAFALRTATNDSTKFSPAYLNTGREFRTPFDNLIDIDLSSCKEVKDFGDRLNSIHDIARDNIVHSQEIYLKNYNKKTKLIEFNIGQKVWYKTHFLSDASKGFNAKLAPKRELCKVVDKISATVYNLVREEDGQLINKVHVNDLLPFIPDLL